MSEKAIFEKGKAIRGGIPLCFPSFATRHAEQYGKHGTARTSDQWRVAGCKSGEGAYFLVLENTELVKGVQVLHIVRLLEEGRQLETELFVDNKDSGAVEFFRKLERYVEGAKCVCRDLYRSSFSIRS